MDKISVAMTTFNDAGTIIEFLRRLLAQSRTPDEIVIADGGSKDQTVELVRDFAALQGVVIRIISDGKRRNIAQGFNDAIKACTNDWILVLGTGNFYDPDFIEKLVERKDSSDAKVIYSNIIGAEHTKFAHIFNQYFLRGNKKQDLNASNHGVLIHRSVFEQIGYFWENFFYAGEDLEYFYRVSKNSVERSYVDSVNAYWETPQTWKEYLKKMKVNSIADWQMLDRNKIKQKCIVQTISLIAYVVLVVLCPWLLLCLIPVGIVVGYKKKTTNVLAILLGLFNRYLMIFYYFKNREYADDKYHVPIELECQY